MNASKIFHQNEYRIKVDFSYDAITTEKLKQIPDAKWSKTNNAWHIPYHKSAFDMLQLMFPELEYINKNSTLKSANLDSTISPLVENGTSKSIVPPHKVAMVFSSFKNLSAKGTLQDLL